MPENTKENMSDAAFETADSAVRDVQLDVRVYPIDEPEGATMAFASVTVDGLVAIRGIRVIEGEDGLFMAMPSSKQEKDGETKYHDIAFPLNKELFKQMRRAVLDEYRNPTDDESRAAAPAIAARDDVKLDVKVFPLENPQGSTLAFASVAVDDLVAIRGIRVVSGEDGLFVSMPQTKQEKDEGPKYHDVAFPVMKGLGKQLRQAVKAEYKAAIGEKDTSLDSKLRDGAEKSAGHVPPQRQAAAKSLTGARE